MTTFLTTSNKQQNISTSFDLLKEIGVDVTKVSLTGYSDTNGVSIYFSHTSLREDARIRISGHGISNKGRMQDTICFSFDVKTMNLKGETKVISKVENNKLFVNKLYSFLK